MTEAANTPLAIFLRLPQVLAMIPVSKSTWWAGIRAGKFPKPVKLTERTSAWRRKDIEDLCLRLSGAEGSEAAESSRGPTRMGQCTQYALTEPEHCCPY